LAPLVDSFERRVTYLRVSLTDRCNYRCTYCMPEEGVTLVPREDVLSYEELARVVAAFAQVGVRRVRLTGGEPTVRRDVVTCVEHLAAIPGIEQVVMTTNGHRLAELAAPLAAAGLKQVNVSVDTLDAEKFHAITRRGDLGRVLDGIEAARALGLPVKMNVVALKGFNEGEVGALCDWAWDRDVVPRFIEWMPMSGGELYAPGSVLEAAEIRRLVEEHTGAKLEPDDPPGAKNATGEPSAYGPARYWRVPGRGKVGIISAMSEHFCDTCNRVRLSATGALHTCLAYDDATDLRAILRGGGSDGDMLVAVRQALAGKRRGHEFSRQGCGAPRKHMVSIGG
jgi:cyclic pyranopterin phosphate synthase